MRLSIVIPVLDSHEAVRRQLLHFSRMDIMDDVELILVDDGSDPPLQGELDTMELRIIETGDTRAWTSALARNAGAEIAEGELLLMTDIDHIVTQDAIDIARNRFDGQKMNFSREFAVLDEEGRFTQDRNVLATYGLPLDTPLRVGTLYNNFVMSRKLFWKIGGYSKELVEKPYPQTVDAEFRSRWHEHQMATGASICSTIPTLYLFPSGQFCGDVDHNPFGLFHTLSRKTEHNPVWRKQQRLERAW